MGYALSGAKVHADGMLQVKEDWNTKPLTDVYIISGSSSCNSGDEVLVTKEYLGSKEECYRYTQNSD